MAPLLTHWGYYSLALSHRCNVSSQQFIMICSYSTTAHAFLVKAPSSCPPNATFAATNLPRTALASSPGSGNTWMRHLLQVATGRFPVTMPQCVRSGPESCRFWPGSGALWIVHRVGISKNLRLRLRLRQILFNINGYKYHIRFTCTW